MPTGTRHDFFSSLVWNKDMVWFCKPSSLCWYLVTGTNAKYLKLGVISDWLNHMRFSWSLQSPLMMMTLRRVTARYSWVFLRWLSTKHCLDSEKVHPEMLKSNRSSEKGKLNILFGLAVSCFLHTFSQGSFESLDGPIMN